VPLAKTTLSTKGIKQRPLGTIRCRAMPLGFNVEILNVGHFFAPGRTCVEVRTYPGDGCYNWNDLCRAKAGTGVGPTRCLISVHICCSHRRLGRGSFWRFRCGGSYHGGKSVLPSGLGQDVACAWFLGTKRLDLPWVSPAQAGRLSCLPPGRVKHWSPIIRGRAILECKNTILSGLKKREALLALIRDGVGTRLFDNDLLKRHLEICPTVAAAAAIHLLSYPHTPQAFLIVRDRLQPDLVTL
jgi:hypothetical protein